MKSSRLATHPGTLVRFADAEAVAQAGAETFVREAEKAIAARGVFRVMLSGGSTPRRMLEVLAAPPLRDEVQWAKVRFFFGDERAVAPDHADSNYRMAHEALLASLPGGQRHVQRMRGESSDLALAALRYERAIASEFGIEVGDETPPFDLVYLGMGEDGHTASLFPHTRALHERRRWIVANEVPQLGTERLTATYLLLERARRIVFLVCGAAKHPVLAEIRAGGILAAGYPSARVATVGEIDWFVDLAAAGPAGAP